MSNKILVTFATMSGSTADIGTTIAEELQQSGTTVDVTPVQQVQSVQDYDAVIIGGPMIMGWHRDALGFVHKQAAILASKQVAYFFTSLNLCQTENSQETASTFFVDPQHGTPPKNPKSLTFKEKHTLPENYVKPVYKKLPNVKPVSVAFFGGKLDYGTLKLPARLFVKFLIHGTEGDRRNWEAIREWTALLQEKLNGATT